MATRAGFKFLNEIINENYGTLRKLKHDSWFLKRQLHSTLQQSHADELEVLCNREQMEETNRGKRQSLMPCWVLLELIIRLLLKGGDGW